MAAGLSLGTFLFYLFNNAVFFLYSIKQWVIAVTVPSIMAGKKEEAMSQERYNRIKLIG